jgi:hypothetical protein
LREGKCVTKDVCILSFKTFEAECFLDFGVGTKFDFNDVDTDKVRLQRKNMDFKIPKESFDKLFKIL